MSLQRWRPLLPVGADSVGVCDGRAPGLIAILKLSNHSQPAGIKAALESRVAMSSARLCQKRSKEHAASRGMGISMC